VFGHLVLVMSGFCSIAADFFTSALAHLRHSADLVTVVAGDFGKFIWEFLKAFIFPSL